MRALRNVSSPSTSTRGRPAPSHAALCSPPTSRSSVLLPAPFGPVTTTRAPRGTSRLTPCSTVSHPGYAKLRSRTSTAGPV